MRVCVNVFYSCVGKAGTNIPAYVAQHPFMYNTVTVTMPCRNNMREVGSDGAKFTMTKVYASEFRIAAKSRLICSLEPSLKDV